MVNVDDSKEGTELYSVVEPVLDPALMSQSKDRVDLRGKDRRAVCTWPAKALAVLMAPFKYWLVVIIFLLLVLYMLCVSIAQGIGMLCMSLIMPYFMKLVYPSPLGKIHASALGCYRRWFIGKGGHSRSIRVDLLANPSGGAAAAPADDGSTPAMLRYSVHTIACLADNYAYVIVDRSGPPPYKCAFVDPCEPDAVIAALAAIAEQDYPGESLLPVAILTTHHHWDHAAGNWALKKKFPGIAVYGGRDDRVAGCTHRMSDGDIAAVGQLEVHSIHAPCHTRGSLLFKIDGPTPCFFGGDTLFCGGCGAAFEGSQADMNANFVKIWRLFPPHTLVFPGHEYSSAILPGYLNGGAPWPESSLVYAKVCSLIWRAQQLRQFSPPVPTVPLLLADELLINSNFAELRVATCTLIAAWRQYENMLMTNTMLEQQFELEDGASASVPLEGVIEVSQHGTNAEGVGISPPASPPSSASSSSSTCTSAGGQRADAVPPRPSQPPSGANYWTTASMTIVPGQQLARLEQVIQADPVKAVNLIQQFRSFGAFAPTTVAEGAPINARIHHAPPLHLIAMERWHDRHANLTSVHTTAAISLLSVPGARGVHHLTLRRAMTSGLLAPRQALPDVEFDTLKTIVGVDAQGFISAERFNTALVVLKPPTPPTVDEPAKRSRLRRLTRAVGSVFRRKPRQRYEEADLSDDGNAVAHQINV